MAKMVFLITTYIERGLAVAEAWQEAGAPGVTLIESHGLHRLQEQSRSLEINLFVSMASVISQSEETNQIIFTVVDDHMVDAIIDAACDVLGNDLTKPDTGVAFVLPVERTIGMRRTRPADDTAPGESGG